MNYGQGYKCPFDWVVLGFLASGGATLLYNHFKNKKYENTYNEYIPPNLLNNSLRNELIAAIECAQIAGQNIMNAINDRTKNISSKGDIDFVTETDKSNEIYIFQNLRKKFPLHKFIGEETSAANGEIDELTNFSTWIVDPVDGYLHTHFKYIHHIINSIF